MLSESELGERLLQVEYMALQALVNSPGPEYVAALQSLADAVLAEAMMQKRVGTLSSATRRLCMRIGARINQLTSVLSQQHTEVDSLRSAATKEVSRIVTKPRRARRAKERERVDQPLNAVHMRDWFLRHLGHPFPTRNEKLEILLETNRSTSNPGSRLEYNQAMLWFINSRRRSGWTLFLRKYANGDKTMLMDIAKSLETELGGTHTQRGWSAGPTPRTRIPKLTELLPEMSESRLDQMRSDWAAIVEWVTVGVKDRVGDWVDKVIESVPRPKEEPE
ncbi:hypothetical protein MCUN1_000388 [Malassezia cuniculi]|uniref:Uncharacterized protein n=1 Tax=Malassezia cuniculi TaxID=948313 RepID=A0AAF0ER74_9BASI|nr:hypothetical protein MCUN1_000388 [Malassezia cuniculi]